MNTITTKQPVSFSSKVTTSAFWIFLFQILDNILGFIRLLVLARILTPNDFGLVAIAWLILQTIGAFTQTGMQQTLIHKPHIEKYLNTAWTYLLLRGIFLYSILFLSAPFLGTFFSTPESISIIKVIGLTLVLEGLGNIGTIYFQKNLTFNKQFIFQISGNLVDFIVAIGLALLLKDVWALVYGSLANSITKVILSYILSAYRPKFEFKYDIFKELNSYGKWIAGSNILQFIYSQGDDLLVGKILGPASLGFYQLAYRISNLPASQITHLISTVMFPAYSNIQTDKKRISSIYLSVLQAIMFLSFFVGTIIICFAYDFTKLFLGDKWLPIVSTMQILTLWGIIRSIGATTGPVWQALGTPKTVTKIQIIQTIILIAIIYPFTLVWNIEGTSFAVVIAALIPNLIAYYLICKTLEIKLSLFIKEILYPLSSSIILILSYYFLHNSYFNSLSFLNFFLLFLICSCIYLLISVVHYKLFKYSVFNNVYPIIKNFVQSNNPSK